MTVGDDKIIITEPQLKWLVTERCHSPLREDFILAFNCELSMDNAFIKGR